MFSLLHIDNCFSAMLWLTLGLILQVRAFNQHIRQPMLNVMQASHRYNFKPDFDNTVRRKISAIHCISKDCLQCLITDQIFFARQEPQSTERQTNQEISLTSNTLTNGREDYTRGPVLGARDARIMGPIFATIGAGTIAMPAAYSEEGTPVDINTLKEQAELEAVASRAGDAAAKLQEESGKRSLDQEAEDYFQNSGDAENTQLTAGTFKQALNANFPSALTSKQTADRVTAFLRNRGYNMKNTLYGSSICSDEINASTKPPKSLSNELQERFGDKAFSLGGLAGVPFVGRSGLKAFTNHVPDDGRLLIMFGPHVGISEEGIVGEIRREGQTRISEACGATIGAFNAMSKQDNKKKSKRDRIIEFSDVEAQYIVQELSRRMDLPSVTGNPLTAVTYHMYAIIRDILIRAMATVPAIADNCTEVAVLGGIIINQYQGDDYFLPLSFQLGRKDYCTEKLKMKDVYEVVFGEKPGPQIQNVLGSKTCACNIVSDVEI